MAVKLNRLRFENTAQEIATLEVQDRSPTIA